MRSFFKFILQVSFSLNFIFVACQKENPAEELKPTTQNTIAGVHNNDKPIDEKVHDIKLKKLYAIGGENQPLLRVMISSRNNFIYARQLTTIESEVNYISIYDNNGNFVKKFGGLGNGPGEFQDLKFLTIIHDSLLLYDRRTYKICFL